MSLQQPAPRPLAQQIRRWVVGVIIVSFGIAALGGIAVLLSGAFNDTAGRVLATTALTGLFSVAALCGVALLGKQMQWFGWVTVGISVIALGRVLWLLWGDPSWNDTVFEITVTLCILAAVTAIVSLLLLLSDHDRSVVRVLLYITIGFIALGTLLTLLSVWQLVDDGLDSYWRGTGVVWIIAALGIVVLPVMSLLLRAPKQVQPPIVQQQQPVAGVAPGFAQAQAPAVAQTSAQTLPLSPDSVARIEAVARGAGITPDELVRRLLP